MSGCIDKLISKVKVQDEEYIACMFMYHEWIVHFSFFQKIGDKQFKEVFLHLVSNQLAKELIRKVRNNEVAKVTLSEAKEFESYYNQTTYAKRKFIKSLFKRNNQSIKIDDVGEVAGHYYIVVQRTEMPYKEIYFVEEDRRKKELDLKTIPSEWMDIVILDYVHHHKIEVKPVYLAIDKQMIIGLKKHYPNAPILYVVNIQFKEKNYVSANKAHLISKNNSYQYRYLYIEEIKPALMESLEKESKWMIHDFVSRLGIEIIE